ncbi:MAG TPA: hypothetical protein VKQ36_10240 [Ktedonobacterales bacterium]|nr:hypothetical protein [Ktedonobacterales bacterium]
MRDTQPPITNDEEYRGYQAGRDKLTKLVEEREARLIAALARGDNKRIEAMRFDLFQVLRDRQGIIDALRAYEQHQLQSA